MHQTRLFSKIISIENGLGETMKFSMKVANYIMQQNLTTSDANAVCSPLLMDIALNIIELGSKGETLEQLLHLYGCQDVEEFSTYVSILGDVLKEESKDSADDNGPKLCFANALWIDQRYPLKEPFQQIIRDLHQDEAMAVDFKNKVLLIPFIHSYLL